MSDMEFSTMNLNWTLPNEVTEQFLDILSSPLPALGAEVEELALIAEPVVI